MLKAEWKSIIDVGYSMLKVHVFISLNFECVQASVD